tara:strand:- start:6656 stop:7924 length:1269 start_codon:yes stop_codon:yes gene_type:complete
VANSTAPLLGLVDTAVIGRTGSVASLGAIALGSLIFSFIFWTFGFLRMGTTGFVAQASGAKDEFEVRVSILRSALIGIVIGLVLVLAQIPIFKLTLQLLKGSDEVEALALTYLKLRIWGAPATLASYAIMGGLIGLGKSKTLLAVQALLNILNIGLDVLLAGCFGMGVAGIGLGTMVAEWIAGLVAAVLIINILKRRHDGKTSFWTWSFISDGKLFVGTIVVQLNIMIRTLSLLVGSGWFIQQGAKLGDVILAANHILLQFISFSAFFLDGIAYATEALVGSASGAKKITVFSILARRTGILSGITAIFLATTFFIVGPTIIHVLTDLETVRQTTPQFLPFAAIYILVSFVAFQLDGIFIGVTRTKDMRNAAIASLIIYLAAGTPMTIQFGNQGLWITFIGFIILRAVSLGMLYPGLKRSIA